MGVREFIRYNQLEHAHRIVRHRTPSYTPGVSFKIAHVMNGGCPTIVFPFSQQNYVEENDLVRSGSVFYGTSEACQPLPCTGQNTDITLLSIRLGLRGYFRLRSRHHQPRDIHYPWHSSRRSRHQLQSDPRSLAGVLTGKGLWESYSRFGAKHCVCSGTCSESRW